MSESALAVTTLVAKLLADLLNRFRRFRLADQTAQKVYWSILAKLVT